MKLAAIDIGSNAIRLQITKVLEYQGALNFKKLEYVRFPLRLGHDVFNHGKVEELNMGRFVELMRAFKILIDLYEVHDYYACATSAMREAINGRDLVSRVWDNCRLQIDIISGEEEAAMINRAILSQLDEGGYIHIDVGGGSTELNIYHHRERIATRSFPLGTVREIEHQHQSTTWQEMENWVTANSKHYHKMHAVGTGGNISKIFELSGKTRGNKLSVKKIEAVLKMLHDTTMEERVFQLLLNPDRADVIVPAGKIYLHIMKAARASSIIIPDVGLKDGIMQYLYDRNVHNTSPLFRY